MASVGVIATFAGILQAIYPTIFSDAPAFMVLGFVSIVSAITYLVVRPKKNVTFGFSDERNVVSIEVADIFKYKSLVVTADQAFSFKLEDIGEDSLMGQMQVHSSDFIDQLKANLRLSEDGALFEAGSVLDISLLTSSTRVFVLACGRPSDEGSAVSYTHLTLPTIYAV